MKITIESTDKITQIGDVPVRVWSGMTEAGVPCFVFVHRLAVRNGEDQSQFDAELREMSPPIAPRFVPLSAIL